MRVQTGLVGAGILFVGLFAIGRVVVPQCNQTVEKRVPTLIDPDELGPSLDSLPRKLGSDIRSY
jgi:hypothetical protein